MSNNERKTETKVSMDEKGNLVKTEVPVFEMPTEVKDINFEPNSDVILAEFVPFTETVKSGIIIPAEAQKDRAPKALIISVGSNVTKYFPGDVIVYKPGVPPMELEGRMIFVLNEYGIIGKYKK